MSYVKNNWQAGDKITAAKLNNMENGIADASQGGGGGSDLPPYTGNNVGDFLAVVGSGSQSATTAWVNLETAFSGTPEKGDVLLMNESGDIGWGAPLICWEYEYGDEEVGQQFAPIPKITSGEGVTLTLKASLDSGTLSVFWDDSY